MTVTEGHAMTYNLGRHVDPFAKWTQEILPVGNWKSIKAFLWLDAAVH
jgi:hypothetical protein